MGLSTAASAALVFLILYAILFGLLLLGFFTRRLRLCFLSGIILFHVMIRLASQATGVAFGVMGEGNPSVGDGNTSFIVAYFILGAEGYYTLILGIYCFLFSWQTHSPASDSSLQPPFASSKPWYKRLIPSFIIVGRATSVMHFLVISATSFIMTGGSMLNRDNNAVQQVNRNTLTARALRSTGLAMLLIVNVFLFYCIVGTIRQSRRESHGKRTHPTLLLLLATCPLLFIRGVYGVMSGILPAFNYFNPNNYGKTGYTSSFVISESIMVTTMEWCSCTLLMLTYITLLNDPQMADSEVHSESEKDRSGETVEA